MNSPKSARAAESLGVIQPHGFPGLPTGWASETETFLSVDKSTQLFAVRHFNQAKPGHRALVILHGMGEHGGRYLHFPHYLHELVDEVYAHDHRGHGRSQGLRGHSDRFDALVDDSALAIRRVHERLMDRYGKAEVHLLGHSMGGHLAIRTLLLYPNSPLLSATATAPFFGVKMKVNPLKTMSARILSRVWGTLQLSTNLDPKLVSHDVEVQQAYEADRLIHDKMTPKFYMSLVPAMADTLSRHSGIKVPLQMLVPLQDGIVDAALSKKFFENLRLEAKRLKTYPDFYHEITSEIGKEEVFEDIGHWIRAHSRGL